MFARTGWRGHAAQIGAETVARALKGHKCGNGWTARCPAHDDRNPSLSITEDRDGRVLLHCFAGCPRWVVISTLRARGLWSRARRSSFPPPPARLSAQSSPTSFGKSGPSLMTACWHGQSMSGRAWHRWLERLPTLELRRAPRP
jgi:hypothetical protein